MNFNQLQAFLTLADCLNLTETANIMHCSQPAMTQKIQTLEQEMSTVLFDRIGKRMYLTRQGEEFRVYASQLVNTLSAAHEHLRQLDNPLKGTVTFGTSHFVGVYLIPELLSLYKKRAPDVIFSIEIRTSQQLLQKLEGNEVEFLFLSDRIPLDEDRYRLTDFYHDTLVLVCSPNHHLAKVSQCQLADLRDEPFLIKPSGSATRSFIFKKLDAENIKLNNLIEISSLEAIKQCVIHNLGVSIISRLAVSHEIATGRLVELHIGEMIFKRGIRIVQHAEKHMPPATAFFMKEIKFLVDGLNKTR
ncbi:LysR family transcriptional regulator [Aeromonas allosaccharophila]|uniref:LysR family transcriptional regulator n=1 Tax=Aeromonas TaxID=642 RepID=UPI0005A6EFC6|nr:MULTISPECIES: LysR family transcriptional regulator [Aeromonas]MBL0472590.1 LysR family transcriptional regulator [Aeromonas veronii]MBL0625012.1 LysR family transcriptional regulator [Aeromonas veronii]MCF5912202.1 LysR family transcriptional regulator [Aeromonas veronii]HDX8364762.1 LysR family transcriptional regulator [Aeromonas veronii]